MDPDVDEYDSAESMKSDCEDSNEEDDEEDVFADPLANPQTNQQYGKISRADHVKRKDNMEHCDSNSYSWLIMRLAILKIAQSQLQDFLNIAGIEMQELAVSSPLVHGALRALSQWQMHLTEQLASRETPPGFIPGCFPEEQLSGPPIHKYRLTLFGYIKSY